MKKFEVGQEYRVVNPRGARFSPSRKDDIFVINSVYGEVTAYIYSKGALAADDYFMTNSDVKDGHIVLIEDCDDTEKSKFEVGQEYRIVKVDDIGYDQLQEDQTLVVREVNSSGNASMHLKGDFDAGNFYMLEEKIDEGAIVLIEDCDDTLEVSSTDYGRIELEVGQQYGVIDPDGFGYPESLVQGDLLCITSSEGDGAWLCHKADTGLTAATSDTYTLFLSDVNDGFVELKYTPPLPVAGQSSPESQTSQYLSTVFEDEYDSLEEALVGETFYEYIEHLNCDDLVLKEKLIEMLTYEQRKIVVLHALALRKAG